MTKKYRISHALSVSKKIIIGKTVPIQLAQVQFQKIVSVETYSPLMNVTQLLTACYIVPLSSLVTIHKELAKAKQKNHQLRKNVLMTPPNKVLSHSQW